MNMLQDLVNLSSSVCLCSFHVLLFPLREVQRFKQWMQFIQAYFLGSVAFQPLNHVDLKPLISME